MRPWMVLAVGVWLAPAASLADVSGSPALSSAPSVTTLPSRPRLDARIAQARRDSPTTFAAVASVVARASALDHAKQGRFFPMTPLLRGVTRGRPGAALALLEPIVHPERFGLPAAESARIALRAGLLEAAGDARDPGAAPIYRAIVATGTEHFEVRAAVEALGKLGLDSDVAMIASLAATPGPKQDAAIAGLGACRRLEAARALERVAAQRPTGARARALLWSLATMASAWALATPSAESGARASAAERNAMRDVAARAALTVFVGAPDAQAGDALRLEAANALLTIDAPDTPRWIADAKTVATPALAAALSDLDARFARNPTRSHARRTP